MPIAIESFLFGPTLTAYLQGIEIFEVGFKQSESKGPQIQHLWSDLSINRKCRSWDQMMQWRQAKYLRSHLLKGVTKAERTKQSPSEWAYYQRYGCDGSNLYLIGIGYDL